MKFLLGTVAYHAHAQQIAKALDEADALGLWCAGGVDNPHAGWSKFFRRVLASCLPGIDRRLARRRITTVSPKLVRSDWRWEGLRVIARPLRLGTRLDDWLWERSELCLDRRCATLMHQPSFDVFLGVEHGALGTIRAAKTLGKKSVVAFTSPHHVFYKRWVNAEYDRFPKLLTPATKRLQTLAKHRDARRDEEARLADAIHANSRLTAQTLIDAGIPREKLAVAPLGAPPAIVPGDLPDTLHAPMRFIYAGPLSVHKGGHYLLKAWEPFAHHRGAELHCYGAPMLPKRCYNRRASNVIFHGTVTYAELLSAYQRGALLVFPTLCDGFGMVVLEALANGLPVLTTRNAGAAEFINDHYNGFVVPPASAAAITERMEWCLRHPTQLLAMRRDAVETARRWTWAHFRMAFRQCLGAVLRVPMGDLP